MRSALLALLTIAALGVEARVRAVRHPAPDRTVHYRGDAERSGVYRTSGPRTFSRIAWQRTVPAGSFSAPVYAFGRVFVPIGSGRLAALDAVTGATRWTSPSMGAFTSPPAITEDAVYVSGEDKRIYALDPASGVVLWSFAADDWGVGAPLVNNGVMYFGTEAGSMYALDVATRAERWRFAAGGPIHANVVLSRGTIFLWAGSTIYALSSATGREIWRKTREGIWYDAVVGDGLMIAFGSDLAVVALDIRDGSERWRANAPPGTSGWNHPSVSHGVVCLTSDAGRIVALDVRTGASRWSYAAGDVPAEPFIADGVLYVGTGTPQPATHNVQRRVIALDVATGLELFAAPVTGHVDRGVAIGDGRLFIVTANGVVYALE